MFRHNIILPGHFHPWRKLLFTFLFSAGAAFLFSQEDIRKVSYQFPGSDIPIELTVEVVDSLVILEGDIVLGTESELFGIENRAAVIAGANRRWEGGIMPFEIESGHPQRNAILQAVAHVNENTNLTLIERNPGIDGDFVRFVTSGVCSSAVGRSGGRQNINLASGCGFGAIVHEICHAAGLFHEQARTDRDNFVTINWDNIQENREGNFQTYLERGITGFNHGPYNYNSIMHYGPMAFSSNGLATITVNSPPAPAGTTIGQRSRLDEGDISAINTIYPCPSDVVFLACGLPFSGLILENVSAIQTIWASYNGCSTIVPPNYNFVWQAGYEITFSPGFSAMAGTNFWARLRDCTAFVNGNSIAEEGNNEMEESTLEEEEAAARYLNVFPNPFQNTTTIAFSLPREVEASLQVYDSYGKLIHQQSQKLPAGHQELAFDGSRLTSGIYNVVLRFEDTSLARRMVIAK